MGDYLASFHGVAFAHREFYDLAVSLRGDVYRISVNPTTHEESIFLGALGSSRASSERERKKYRQRNPFPIHNILTCPTCGRSSLLPPSPGQGWRAPARGYTSRVPAHHPLSKRGPGR